MSETYGREVAETEIAGTSLQYIESDPVIAERFETGWDETELFERIAHVSGGFNTTFWDVGACIGVHSLFAANHFDNIVAFEPVSTNAGTMVDNMSINNAFDTVSVKDVALGNENTSKSIEIRESNDAGHGRHSLKPESFVDSIMRYPVDVQQGDSVAEQTVIPNVIKIDVEGAEGNVLDGLTDVLNSPECCHVFLETHPPGSNDSQASYHDYGHSLEEILKKLTDADFVIEHCGKPYLFHAHN